MVARVRGETGARTRQEDRIFPEARESRLSGEKFLLDDPRLPRGCGLSLVTQPLLMPVRLHALAALMFGDFGFAAFFDGTHRKKRKMWSWSF